MTRAVSNRRSSSLRDAWELPSGIAFGPPTPCDMGGATPLLRNLRSLGLAISSPLSANALVQDDVDDLCITVAAVVTALVSGHCSGNGAADARPGRNNKKVL